VKVKIIQEPDHQSPEAGRGGHRKVDVSVKKKEKKVFWRHFLNFE
jgi:hypothetical protein